MNAQPQVPDIEGVDLDFTPKSYFTGRDLGLAIPSDIMGRARRDMARRLAADLAADVDDMPPELLESVLTELQRDVLGAIHPSLMGGEYLVSEARAFAALPAGSAARVVIVFGDFGASLHLERRYRGWSLSLARGEIAHRRRLGCRGPLAG